MHINKGIYIIAIFFFCMPAGRAQQITLSNEINFRSEDGFSLLGQVNDTILLFRESNYKYSIDVLNDKLEFLFKKELFFEKQKIHFNAIQPGKNDFAIFYSYESKFQLFMKVIHYDLRGNPLDTVELFEEPDFLNEDNFSFVLSEDEQMVMLFRESKYNTLECILYDVQNRQKLWYNTIEFENYRLNYDLKGILLSNEALLVLAFEKYNSSFRKSKHFQELYMVDPYLGKTEIRKIDFDSKLSVSFNFAIDEKNGEIIVAGLYAPKSTSKAAGYYLYKLNPKGITQELLFNDFSKELLMKHKGKKRNPKLYIPDLNVKDLVLRNDGGLLMVTEMQKEVSRENMRRRYIDYHYEDMVVVAIHPDGDLFWDDLIRKYQLSYDDDARFSSYFLFKSPSRLRIIFNDEIKSENTISEYLFNPLGYGVRNSLFSTDLHRLKLLFEDAIQLSSNSFIVPSMYNNKYRIIKLSY